MKDLRFPEGDTPVASPHDKGSYLATYWVLEDKHKEHFDWAGNQVVDLYMNNEGSWSASTPTRCCSPTPNTPIETTIRFRSNSPSTTTTRACRRGGRSAV